MLLDYKWIHSKQNWISKYDRIFGYAWENKENYINEKMSISKKNLPHFKKNIK